MKIISGKTEVAPKVMITGLPGAGKSYLAAMLPKALFLDIEGGLSFLDVTKTPVSSADELMYDLRDLYYDADKGKQEYKYIVVDSVDWLVNLFVLKTSGACQGKDVEKLMDSATLTLNKSQGGYGNGKQVLENYVRNIFVKFLEKLNRQGYGIILIAHADKKTLMDSDGTPIDRIAPKMDINSMNVFVEWVDNLFYIRKDDDGVRHLVVNPTDAIMAKNRMGLQQTEFIMDDKFDFEKLITGKAQ